MRHLSLLESSTCLLAGLGLAVSGTSLCAQVVYTEPFNAEESARIGLTDEEFTVAAYVDYSSFDVGVESHSIPEAPSQIEGSPATRGLLLQANVESDENFGLAGGVVVTLTDEAGGTPVPFSDSYKLKFDAYVSIDPDVGSHSGTTEVLLWAIGVQADAEQNIFRNRNSDGVTGTWGWLSSDGDIGGSGDASILVNNEVDTAINEPTDNPSDMFLDVFGDDPPFPGTPSAGWTTVEITVLSGNVTVAFNGVTFFEIPDATAAEGFITIGYEDPFNSLSASPDFQWMILDNVTVETIQDPTIEVKTQSAFTNVTEEGGASDGELLVKNNQEVDLVISEVKLSGEGAGAFTLLNTPPITIAGGQEAVLEFAFNPPAENGTFVAMVEVVSNDPERPNLIVNLEASRVVATPLLAHFKFDDTEGSTSPADASGNDVTGSFQERDPIAFGSPALAADGGTAIGFIAADAADTGSFAVADPLHTPTTSVSLWIKPEVIIGNHALFNRDARFGGNDGIYGCFIDPDGALVFRSAAEPVIISDVGLIEEGATYHVVITHLDEDGFGNESATRTRLYVNGDLVVEVAGIEAFGFDDYPADASTRFLHIATKTGAGSGYTGVMDDFQIYSVELTAEQVAAMFANPGETAFGAQGAPAFEITEVTRAADTGQVSLTWRSKPGRTYVVEAAADPSKFEELEDGVKSGGETTSFTDMSIPDGTSERYYRVVEE